MRSYETSVAIGDAVDLGAELEIVATVHLPDTIDDAPIVLFGYPGGGYGRGYYDIALLPGYSQAKYHTDRGCIFIACDHLGIGGSTPVHPFALTIERIIAANHAAARVLVQRLRAGRLIEGLAPVEVRTVIGLGQSMGGCLLVAMQGTHATFDGIGVLGYSVLGSCFPTPDGPPLRFQAPGRDARVEASHDETLGQLAKMVDVMRYCFHAADEEPALAEADLPVSGDLPPWRVGGAPPCAATMMAPGAVGREAAAIEVPALLAFGAIDLIEEPRAEPAAFPRSTNLSVLIVPRMAHMHNFARTRERLWRRIDRFAREVADDRDG